MPYRVLGLLEVDIGWDGGLDVCVDLTGSSPLTQTGRVDFVPGRAMIDTAQRKHGKYMAKCAAIGYGFLSFSFSSLGELKADAVTLLKRIRKFSMAQDIGARVAVHIFNRIIFAIAKRWGDHDARCSSEVGVKFRHNLGHAILVDICSKVRIMVRKGAPMSFHSEDGKDLRHADLLLFNWLQGSWGSLAQCRGEEKEKVFYGGGSLEAVGMVVEKTSAKKLIQPSGKHVLGDMQLFRWTLLRLILGLDVKDTGDVQALVKKKGTPMNKIMRSNKAVHDNENQNPNFVTPNHNMKSSTDKKKEIGSSSLRQEIRRKLRRKLLAHNLFVGNSVLNRITEFCNDLKRLATRKRVNEIEQMETKNGKEKKLSQKKGNMGYKTAPLKKTRKAEGTLSQIGAIKATPSKAFRPRPPPMSDVKILYFSTTNSESDRAAKLKAQSSIYCFGSQMNHSNLLMSSKVYSDQ
ncbi:hypothetical protein Tco_1465190 [Tanacetum coccineum]